MTPKTKPLQVTTTFVQGSVGQIILQVTPGTRQTPLTLYQANQLGGIQFFKSIPMFDEELFTRYYICPGFYHHTLLGMMGKEPTARATDKKTFRCRNCDTDVVPDSPFIIEKRDGDRIIEKSADCPNCGAMIVLPGDF